MTVDFSAPDDTMAAPVAAEGMPLSVALGQGPIQLFGKGYSVNPLYLVGNEVIHQAGDMGQKVAAQVAAPAPKSFLSDFTMKPV